MRRFDIVHAHLFPTLLWVALAGLIVKRPIKLFTEHSTYNRRRKHPLWKRVDDFVYRRYRAIVCISQGTRVSLTGYLPFLKEKVRVIHNGIDMVRFHPGDSARHAEIAEMFGIPPVRPRPPIVACVANLHPRKGQDILLAAMADLPDDVHVTLAGTGAYGEHLRQQAADLGIAARVHFLGYRADAEKIYRRADCCVIPSRWEGFGLVAVEAMASGLPVIASDLPGLREVVGDAALLFPAGDAKALALRLKSLLYSDVLRGDCIRKGLAQAKKFTLAKMAEEYKRLYDQVMIGKNELDQKDHR